MHIHAISIGFAGARALAARRTEPRPSVEKTKAATPTSASSARLARAPCLTSSRSSFAGGARLPVTALHAQTAPRVRSLVVRASGMGSQYGDSFADVDKVLVSYFTFRALKETLAQIQQTDVSPNKEEYKWLYTFASENNPNDSQKFIKALFAARPDYGQRILAQRQALFESWQTAFMPESVSIIIEEQNLEHLRDQLFATVNLSEECLFMDDESECLSVDKKTEEESLEEEEELELVEAVAAAPVAAEEEEEEEDQQDGEIIP